MPLTIEQYVRYCPRCGGQDIHHGFHDEPGTARCRGCRTVFSILRVEVELEEAVTAAGGEGEEPDAG